MPDYFDHIPDDDLVVATKPDTRTKYPCEPCGGSGRWKSFNGTTDGKCFACNGKGYFFTSAQDRQRTRHLRKTSMAKKVTDARALFEEQHPGMVSTLAGMVSWNEFASSLVGQIYKRGTLTDSQVAAAERMIAKTADTKIRNAQKREDDAVKVDLSSIRTMFDAARSAGRKAPRYFAEGLTITRASDSGRNAGSLYVKGSDDMYLGKITAENVYYKTREADDNVAGKLTTIASDPKEAAIRHARETGQCGCCGRTLTNPASIEMGIGPICAEKFGF